MQSQDLSVRITRNSMFGALRFVLSVPILLIITPYMLKQLGIELYGIWALLGIFSLYTQLSDLGITQALVRFVAEYSVTDNQKKISETINTALLVYAAFGAMVILALVLLSNTLVVHVLRIPAPHAEEATLVVNVIAVTLVMSIIAGLFGSVLAGMQRLDISNVVLFGYQLCDACGTVIVLRWGFGLTGLAYSRLVTTTILLSANYFLVRHLLPGFRLRPRVSSRESMKQLISYGVNVQVGTLAKVLMDSAIRLVVNSTASVSAVSFFDIAYRLTNQIKSFFLAALASVLPAAASLHSSNDMNRLAMVYSRSIRYLALSAVPASLIAAAAAPHFVHLWLGDGFDIVGHSLQILLIANIINILGVPPYEILSGTIHIKTAMRIAVLTAIATPCFASACGLQWGFLGIIWAVAISMILSGLLTLSCCNRILQTGFSQFIASMPRAALLSAIFVSALVGMALRYSVQKTAGGWLVLIGAAAVGATLYLVLVLCTGALDQTDKRILGHFVPPKTLQLIRFKNL